MAVKNFDKPFTFKGGIHPPYRKELASGKSIEVCPSADRVVIPLSQHVGAPAKVQVEKGQEVKAGQVIGQSDAFCFSPVHSSVNGTVKAIGPKLHTCGLQVEAIVIDVNREDSSVQKLEPLSDDAKPEQIIARVKEAGLVGLGGAAFPTHIKINPPEGKSIETVLINGCECEPYITCDHRQMLEQSDELIEGLKLIIKAVGAKEGFIAIETNKMNAIELLREKTASMENIHVVAVKTKYPQGAEKQLIDAILKKRVPSGGLPVDVGCLVQNVGTTIAVRKAVKKGQPLIERVITVSGEGIKNPKNLLTRLGTPISHLIEVAGGIDGEHNKIIAGGPMTGIVQTSLDAPAIKGTSAITVLKYDSTKKAAAPEPCIKCARCVDACPVGLLPLRIKAYAEKGLFDELEQLYANDCIECGCCTYVCPAKLPLVHWIRYSKQKLRERGDGK